MMIIYFWIKQMNKSLVSESDLPSGLHQYQKSYYQFSPLWEIAETQSYSSSQRSVRKTHGNSHTVSEFTLWPVFQLYQHSQLYLESSCFTLLLMPYSLRLSCKGSSSGHGSGVCHGCRAPRGTSWHPIGLPTLHLRVFSSLTCNIALQEVF